MQAKRSVETLVSEHLNVKGLVGYVKDSTIASILLSKSQTLVDRQRTLRRLRVSAR